VALVLLALFLAEVTWRGVLLAAGNPYSASTARSDVDGSLHRMGAPLEGVAPSQRLALHPYVGFESVADREAVAGQLRFLRAHEGDLPFTILVLGGSQARIFCDREHNGGSDALVEELRRGWGDPDRGVEVIGHAREAYKQPQQVMLLVHLLALGLEPDVVVNIDGFNEVAIGLLNHVTGLDPSFPAHPQWSHVVGRFSADPSQAGQWDLANFERVRAARTVERLDPFFASALTGSALRAWVQRRHDRWREQLAAVTVSGDVGNAGTDDEALDRLVDIWVNSSSSLRSLCAARGVRYLHVLQPTLHDDGSKTLTPDERRSGATDPVVERGVRKGYPLLRAAIPRLSAAGVDVLDASRLFVEVKERIYYDSCHFNRPGTELLGAAIGRALVDG